jgi:hypothetical protein
MAFALATAVAALIGNTTAPGPVWLPRSAAAARPLPCGRSTTSGNSRHSAPTARCATTSGRTRRTSKFHLKVGSALPLELPAPAVGRDCFASRARQQPPEDDDAPGRDRTRDLGCPRSSGQRGAAAVRARTIVAAAHARRGQVRLELEQVEQVADVVASVARRRRRAVRLVVRPGWRRRVEPVVARGERRQAVQRLDQLQRR